MSIAWPENFTEDEKKAGKILEYIYKLQREIEYLRGQLKLNDAVLKAPSNEEITRRSLKRLTDKEKKLFTQLLAIPVQEPRQQVVAEFVKTLEY